MKDSFSRIDSLSDIEQLPSLAIHETGSLPTNMAIYFLVSNSNVLYIGSAKHLWLRWYRPHHILKRVQAEENLRLHWLSVEMETKALLELEMQLITHFKPAFNTVGITKSASLPASGNSHAAPRQLSLFSASVDQELIPGTYSHRVRVYHSKGKLYYRYTCNVGHDIAYDLHIPGGNVRNPIAKRRAKQVRAWIFEGFTPEEISASILKWRERSS